MFPLGVKRFLHIQGFFYKHRRAAAQLAAQENARYKETSWDDDLDSERDTGPQQDGAYGGDEDTESFLRSVVGNGMQEDAIIDLLLRKMLLLRIESTAVQRCARKSTEFASVSKIVDENRGDMETFLVTQDSMHRGFC